MFSLCFFRSSPTFFTFQDPLVCFFSSSRLRSSLLSLFVLPYSPDPGLLLSSAADVNRANEQAFRYLLQNVAVYAAVTTNASNPNANAQVTALAQRVGANLAPQSGQQQIQDVQAEFAGAQTATKAATDRQTQLKSMSETMLDSIEGVNQDEVATKILALQTSLQASYQTTSMLYQTTLLKYLPIG